MQEYDHPAKYSSGLVARFGAIILAQYRGRFSNIEVLDPFAGTGRIHQLRDLDPRLKTTGLEIEPEWAEMHPYTKCGDATALETYFTQASFDVICTSPTYGNRMADHHDARDGSKRRTYTHVLGRQLHENNSGKMQWGEEYRDLHRKVWAKCHWVQRPGGLFIMNIANHIRKGVEIDVAGWHIYVLVDLGYVPVEVHQVPTRKMKYGANRDARTPGEYILAFRRES